VLQQMAPLNEERKIILLLTDGDPNEYDIVKNALATAQSCGFEVYGIGIGVERLSVLMPETSCNIQNVQELAPAMFGMLQSALKGELA
jgi:cobaltochelatase CobT